MNRRSFGKPAARVNGYMHVICGAYCRREAREQLSPASIIMEWRVRAKVTAEMKRPEAVVAPGR
jgi:hypothetical protein